MGEASNGPQWKKQVNTALDGVWVSTLTTILIIWALFGDDIRLIATHKESDDMFGLLAFISLFVFTIELGEPQKWKEERSLAPVCFYRITNHRFTVSSI
jgi:hypothetical protein